ncbi:MAG: hypothetical protein JEZ01_08350 [Labilibaculum sp.]|nr:hypothetical protein [Labilibaculum sp.]MBI9057772.1 hypothetical protein [Labilibaculum sp.]
MIEKTNNIEKIAIHFDKSQFDYENSQLEPNVKTVNNFLDMVRPIIGDLSDEQYNKLVNTNDRVDFDYFNSLVFDKVLSTKPVFKSLSQEIDPEEVRRIAKIPTYSQEYAYSIDDPYTFSGLCQASMLNSDKSLWKINKGKACLVSGVSDMLREKYTIYATEEIQIERLAILNDIKKQINKLYELSPKKEMFNPKDLFNISLDGQIEPNVNVIIYGQQPGMSALALSLQMSRQHDLRQPLNIPTVKDTKAYQLKQIRK